MNNEPVDVDDERVTILVLTFGKAFQVVNNNRKLLESGKVYLCKTKSTYYINLGDFEQNVIPTIPIILHKNDNYSTLLFTNTQQGNSLHNLNIERI